jgi:hypothetical protein
MPRRSRTKKPEVEIKLHGASLGWVYRIYIGGTYMGTGLTQASARESVGRMLAIYERMNSAWNAAAVSASAKHHVT